MATKVGGVLYSTYEGMTWIQWAKGKRSDLVATDFAVDTYPPSHPLYERLKAVFDVLVAHGKGSHVRLEQDEWDALVGVGKENSNAPLDRPAQAARETETQTTEG